MLVNKMKKKINSINSGISLVDKAWGGFYRGGTYILLGQKKSGKTLLGLQYAYESAKAGEVCLYFTSMRPKDLMIHAASMDFDLQHYMNQNLIIVVRVAPPTDIYEVGTPDNFLVEYLNDIVTVVEQYQPHRLVFDELTHFVGFENISLLQQTFLQTVERIEEKNVTSLFIFAEPATQFAQVIIDSIVTYSTAVIYLQKKSLEENGGYNGGKATITPNIGHTEGQFTSDYVVEPYKGVVFEYDNVPQKKFVNPFATQEESNSPVHQTNQKISSQKGKYKPLTNIDEVPDKYSLTNFYDISEFKLILNNKIALFKSTGETFTLVSLKLDPTAETQKIITINQLQNTIRLSTDKKDKICVIKNNILILLSRNEEKSLNMLVSKMKSNLPFTDKNFIDLVMQNIFAFTYEVNTSVKNADSIFEEIMEDERY
ncbi:MAG: RAD55 family ATPase [Ignavibacteriaceae bacterium]